jgi:hypothetical protein
MSLPGFSAETTLNRTMSRYVMTGGIVPSEAVVLPSSTYCGKCYKSDGVCVQNCTVTLPPMCQWIGGIRHCSPPVNGSYRNPCPIIACDQEPQCCPTGCVHCS